MKNIIHPSKYFERLTKANKNFVLDDAVALSDEIHKAEAEGYEINVFDDDLWAELTEKILLAVKHEKTSS